MSILVRFMIMVVKVAKYPKKFVEERINFAEQVYHVPVKFFLITNKTVPREDFIIISNFLNASFKKRITRVLNFFYFSNTTISF